MKKLFSLFALGITIGASAQQLPNSSFENWKAKCGDTYCWSMNYAWKWSEGFKTRPGIEPEGWNGSSINQQYIMPVSQELVWQSTGQNNEGNAVKISNINVLAGNIAPGFINLGTPWVYPATNSDADGGAYGGIEFTYQPDAIRASVKRTPGKASEKAHIIVYLWNGTFQSKIGKGTAPTKTVDDVDRAVMGRVTADQSGTLIASSDYEFETTKDNDWEEIIVPIVYIEGQEKSKPQKINVILSAGDYWNRGNLKENSTLEVDEVCLMYYSQLASLSYDGNAIVGFDKDTYTYSVDAPYDATKLQAVADGKGATVKTSYDAATGKCVVRVEGEDISVNSSNYHEYTIQFAVPVITSFTNALTVGINGATSIPQETEIQLVKEVDGSYSFALNNFMLGELGIGNVRLTNLTVNGNVFTAEQTIQITEGDAEGVGYWMGPMLGDVPVVLKATRLSDTEMVADIDIDMSATLKQVIKVVFAPLVEINDTENMPALSGLYNVKLNRMFVAGWNTVCLPFNYQVEAFSEYSGVEAQAFDSATEAGLNFVAVEDGVLAANTPYLINFPSATTMPVYFGVNIESTTPQSVTHGDFTFTGTYAAVTDMAGKYGVAKINGEDKITKGAAGSTLKATRAYFTTSGADVQSVSLFFDGEATGIEAVETAGEKAFDVYTISGVQVRRAAKTLDGLQKGIYIVNGKKQVVK